MTPNRFSPPSSLSKTVKLAILHASEMLGLFRLCGRLFRRRLHILCYHGFQLQDECDFRPQLFISGPAFERRLQYIAKQGFSVLPLGEALERLRSGQLPRRALVITVDDGFRSTLSVAGPLLNRFDMPATVYVTTYYMDKQVPVFRLGVQYIFWKAGMLDSGFSGLSAAFGDIVGAARGNDPQQAMWTLIEHGNSLKSEQARQELLCRVAKALNVDIAPLYERHLLSILTSADLLTLSRGGVDIQLHTHRHRFPSDDRAAAILEIEENRKRLISAVGGMPRHFCYPSGIFTSSQWPWLEAQGIESATTCLPGLNRSDTPVYALRRFLDSESIAFIEFKAELSGFNEILRKIKKAILPGSRERVVAAGN